MIETTINGILNGNRFCMLLQRANQDPFQIQHFPWMKIEYTLKWGTWMARKCKNCQSAYSAGLSVIFCSHQCLEALYLE